MSPLQNTVARKKAPLGISLVASAIVLPCFALNWSAHASPVSRTAPEPPSKASAQTFKKTIEPLLNEFCVTCHSSEKQKGDLDLERFNSIEQIRRSPAVWEHVLEQIRDKEMPPKDKPQLSAEQFNLLTSWLHSILDEIALENAGDPGPVVLRRLSNAEYTYTIRDLTGVESLDPAREFPVDGAAGEGFTNASAALVMSPSLLNKYLNAAKEVAAHAVLTHDDIHFSKTVSQRDWTDESVAKIRDFYSRYAVINDQKVDVNGAHNVATQFGAIPLQKYLDALQANASREGLSPRYLNTLDAALNSKGPPGMLEKIRAKFEAKTLRAADIERWQKELWKLNSIGHLGKIGGPKVWMEPVTPLASSHEIRLKLSAPDKSRDVVLYFSASDAGDGSSDDYAVWGNPRLVAAGRADLPLKDLGSFLKHLDQQREQVIRTTVQCLAAAHEAESLAAPLDIVQLSSKHQVKPWILTGWLAYLGIGSAGEGGLGPLLVKKMLRTPDYEFIRGWSGENALSVLANPTDQTVRVPGTMRPHSVAMHPSPKLAAVAAWRSPVKATVEVGGSVQDVHTACGNGVNWTLQHRKGRLRETLSTGSSSADRVIDIGRHKNISVESGDVILLAISPGYGDHSCDLTSVELVIKDGSHEWRLSKDVSPDILGGNPHSDSHGNSGVWHFFGEPEEAIQVPGILKGSLVAQWRASTDAEERQRLAVLIHDLLQKDIGAVPFGAAERALHQQLLAPNGPLLASLLRSPQPVMARTEAVDSHYGLVASQFGVHPEGFQTEADELCVKAPSLVEVRLPASIADGAELVTTARLHSKSGPEASVQMRVLTSKPEQHAGLEPTGITRASKGGAWTTSQTDIMFSSPVLVHDRSSARARFENDFHEFRELFPLALCYPKIVPADEVVTLTLFHREDEPLLRLMLEDSERTKLNRLWEELHFVSEDALALVDAFEQLWQFSSQDGPDKPYGDKRLEPLREPIMRGAEEFKALMRRAEPLHVNAVLRFAERAWRRPLSETEQREMRELYQKLRREELPHPDAVRMLLSRALIAPGFLYRGERSMQGPKAAPVSSWELATRLSYFLWSGPPDQELALHATKDSIRAPDVILNQTRRMLRDSRIRRLATEFGCQWLHVRDLETLDEKSERHFPTFGSVRGAMQEEVVRFFVDLFQENRSVLSLINADHTFVNPVLAAHYGLEVSGTGWQRVEGLLGKGRGGILGFASTLSKQSGASRTSPILRGNWLSEVVLGEKLPRPPKGVPLLPEEAPQGLTERQLIEKHSSDEACANCHRRIDPFGFALEGFDAIGRTRSKDSADLPIDTRTVLPNGDAIDGINGLRNYLLNQKRDEFLRQFCRKLLGYALGRSIQLSDKPLIEAMVAALHADNHRVHSAIELIVCSPQFREIRGRDFKQIEIN